MNNKSEAVKRWRIKNPERHKAIQKTYRLNHKDYFRNWQFVSKYGITASERNQLEQNQKGLCAVCGCPPSNRGLVIDHDKLTDRVRGLLCDNCNKALGLFKENPTALKTAITYLTRSNEKNQKSGV